jgi:hypothetical protein
MGLWGYYRFAKGIGPKLNIRLKFGPVCPDWRQTPLTGSPSWCILVSDIRIVSQKAPDILRPD